MADTDNLKNERLMNAAQLLLKGNIRPRVPKSPWAAAPDSCKEIAAGDCGNISDDYLRNIQKVAQQLVMNSPDKQRTLIKPHLRSTATAPAYEYDSPDSCPPPPNNTPDSGPSIAACVHKPYSTVKGTPHGLAPPISSSRWTATPVSLVGSPGSNLATPGSALNNKMQTPSGLAPPISSSRWTATPVSLVGSPDSNFATQGSALSDKLQTPSSITSPIPSIVVTPPEEHNNSYILSASETSFPSALSSIGTPRLRSDSEGSVSSILSLNPAMLKLIDSSQESISSSMEGFKGSDGQSDTSSDLQSPASNTSKSSTPKDDGGKKKAKDLRKKLLQDLMAAEVTRKEDEELKKHNIKLLDSYGPTGNEEQSRLPHVPIFAQPTYGSIACKIITLILCLTMASFLVAWLFTDLLGPLQRRIVVGDYDSLDADKVPHRLPWMPEIHNTYKYGGVKSVLEKNTTDNIENEDAPLSIGHNDIDENERIGKPYKYGGVKSVLEKITSDNIENEDAPLSTGHNDIDEKVPSIHGHIFDNIEEADLNVLDVPVSDLNRLEETINDFDFIDFEIENDVYESSDSDELDDSIEFDEASIESMKPTILKLLYYNILKTQKHGDVNVKSYTNMYRYLNSFLTTFGSFAATQSKMLNERIYELEQLMEHNTNYTFASNMFKYEIKTGIIDDEFPISGSMLFTCLHRHLQYLQEALENIIYMSPRQSLYVAFKAAYEDILKDYHHWFVEKFYLLGLSSLPNRANALRKLNERFVETTTEAQLSNGLMIVSEQLKELTGVTEVLLNKHKVLQMIPAQVIT